MGSKVLEQYDAILSVGQQIIFDSPDSLYYLAAKGNMIKLALIEVPVGFGCYTN